MAERGLSGIDALLASPAGDFPMLDREEYVEQAYFFRALRERLEMSTPVQEVLAGIREEILTTTRLPMAIDFLLGELQLKGQIGTAMARLGHYFSPFQTFIIRRAEDDSARLDFAVALKILEHEAHYRTEDTIQPAALFVYQFECLARNRLGYDAGLTAIAQDSAYDQNWKAWINRCRFDLGTVEFADLVYSRSQQSLNDLRRQRKDPELPAPVPVLFDAQAGRIARANQGKDPLYMFAALQRQLGYPAVPRPAPSQQSTRLPPHLEIRLQRMESRLTLVEQEQRGGINLTEFYQKNPISEAPPDAGDRTD